MICSCSRRPTPPSVILQELYLGPRDISLASFANAVGVTREHMSDVVNGHIGITAELAIGIAKALNTTPEFWFNLQAAVDC
jgi:antitoxin HigA-1